MFFIPLMITPLGVGYALKMVADITKGPFRAAAARPRA